MVAVGGNITVEYDDRYMTVYTPREVPTHTVTPHAIGLTYSTTLEGQAREFKRSSQPSNRHERRKQRVISKGRP